MMEMPADQPWLMKTTKGKPSTALSAPIRLILRGKESSGSDLIAKPHMTKATPAIMSGMPATANAIDIFCVRPETNVRWAGMIGMSATPPTTQIVIPARTNHVRPKSVIFFCRPLLQLSRARRTSHEQTARPTRS